MIRRYKGNNKVLKNSDEGSSLAIALFFFMLCALMCAGILYLANSSSYGVLKHFNANNITPFVSPEPIPTEDPTLTSTPTPTPDEAHPEEQAAIDLVYNTLKAEFQSAFIEVNNGGEYCINASSNPRSMAYEMISYINSYINRGNFKEKDGNYYSIPLEADGDMAPLTYEVTVNGIKVNVEFDLDGTQESVANTALYFTGINIRITSAMENTTCTYEQIYTDTVQGSGKFKLVWVGASGSTPKRFKITYVA